MIEEVIDQHVLYILDLYAVDFLHHTLAYPVIHIAVRAQIDSVQLARCSGKFMKIHTIQ